MGQTIQQRQQKVLDSVDRTERKRHADGHHAGQIHPACPVCRDLEQAQLTGGRFVLWELVVFRDDPNGEIFEVISINGDNIGLRGSGQELDANRILHYEDTLLQSAPECPASPNGRHEADIKSAELQWDGDGLYIDVHCGICGASGCAGKITAFDEVQW